MNKTFNDRNRSTMVFWKSNKVVSRAAAMSSSLFLSNNNRRVSKLAFVSTAATFLLLASSSASNHHHAFAFSPSSQPPHKQTTAKVPTTSNDVQFSFGLIADVQWADAEDGSNFAKTVIRHYRGAFENLVAAVDWWKSINKQYKSFNINDDDHNDNDNDTELTQRTQQERHSQSLSFIAQLGDIIDGINVGLGQSDQALSLALAELDKLGPTHCPSINLVGNHELYNFDRKELSKAKWLRHGNEEYYSFVPRSGFRIVVLDAYQIALIGHDRDDPRRLEAVELIRNKNPNIDVDGNGNGKNWFDGIPKGSPRKTFVPYNGGYGTKQLTWLKNVLEQSFSQNEKVIVLSHVIIHPKACGGATMAWDYEQALEILHSVNKKQRYKSHNNASDSNASDNTVVAVFCGHDHRGCYHCDDFGIHHCTFSSPLNKGADGSAYGMVQVSHNALELVGPCIDDLLPDVGNRPAKQAFDWRNRDDDDVPADDSRGNFPLESVVLPFGPAKSQKDDSESSVMESEPVVKLQ